MLFSGDEEAGTGVMHAFLSSPHAAAISEVIVCEPTARVAGIAHRGVLGQRAQLVGPGGHSSKADHLPKPLAQLARLAAALDDAGIRRLQEGPSGMTGTCLNIAGLAGGVAFNVIPAARRARVVAAPVSGLRSRRVGSRGRPARRHARSRDHARDDDRPRPVRVRGARRPRSARSRSAIGALDFWTEAALWAAHGADAIVIGPGDIAQAHARRRVGQRSTISSGRSACSAR